MAYKRFRLGQNNKRVDKEENVMNDQQDTRPEPDGGEPIDETLTVDEGGVGEVTGAKDTTGDTYAERDEREGGRA